MKHTIRRAQLAATAAYRQVVVMGCMSLRLCCCFLPIIVVVAVVVVAVVQCLNGIPGATPRQQAGASCNVFGYCTLVISNWKTSRAQAIVRLEGVTMSTRFYIFTVNVFLIVFLVFVQIWKLLTTSNVLLGVHYRV